MTTAIITGMFGLFGIVLARLWRVPQDVKTIHVLMNSQRDAMLVELVSLRKEIESLKLSNQHKDNQIERLTPTPK